MSGDLLKAAVYLAYCVAAFGLDPETSDEPAWKPTWRLGTAAVGFVVGLYLVYIHYVDGNDAWRPLGVDSRRSEKRPEPMAFVPGPVQTRSVQEEILEMDEFGSFQPRFRSPLG